MAIYGKDTIIKIYFVSLLLLVASLFINHTAVKIIFLVLCLFLILFTSFFFRDPARKIPNGITNEDVLSPADGKIVEIKKIKNKYPELFSCKELSLISIFMSPLNVHVNRFPLSGKINYYNYIKGKYVVAFNEKSSDENERTEIGIISGTNQIVFIQIAGYVARRIVCNIKTEDYAVAGERFGMIKFGSRVDIIFKPDTKILVNLHDKVKAGVSILAKLTR
ncbi:MAG: phosphatidylserine decarboxylase [Ignavibacteria bacterium]|nr:phosphatidylserine decarboxylase [Ignavibacteria bacterium]